MTAVLLMPRPARVATAKRLSPPRLGSVLVASDFSPGAARAVERAIRLRFLRGATIRLVHVVPSARSEEREAVARRRLHDVARAAMKAAERAGAWISVHPVILRGDPVEAILTRARAERSELIVIGRSGEPTLRKLFLGSTADRLIQRSPAPVLVVRGDPAGPYRRPHAAIDLRAPALRALELAGRVVGRRGTTVHVVHAFPPPRERELAARRTRLRRRLASYLLSEAGDVFRFEIIVRTGAAASVIPAQARRGRADLLVLGTEGRAGIRRLLRASVAREIVRAAPCDVLVVRAPAARSG